ncbi:MAG: NAD(P)H-dependent oxidoreductase [candidate division Zixibacteria bacterium]|nr:NAD(P)H-dependent oxidoreductase [candidate division Zixibacteria bacterium]
MGYTPDILAFSGSLREESYNAKLVRIAAEGARAAGANVTIIRLRDYPMPLYDADVEAHDGLPETVLRFKNLMLAHQGLLIAAPEYNSSITAALKNAIDWASRPRPGEAALACFDGKVAALMSASPGALGGLRGLVHVRAILGNIRVLVLPDQVAVPGADTAFEEDATLKDTRRHATVGQLGAKVTLTLKKLYGP